MGGHSRARTHRPSSGLAGRYSVYLLYWYKSTDTDADGAGSAMVHAIQKQLDKFVGAKRCEFTCFTGFTCFC